MANNLVKPSIARRYVLDMAAKTKHHTYTQVRQVTLDAIEAAARAEARHQVSIAPSKGKTI